jgi:hypothetical protein
MFVELNGVCSKKNLLHAPPQNKPQNLQPKSALKELAFLSRHGDPPQPSILPRCRQPLPSHLNVALKFCGVGGGKGGCSGGGEGGGMAVVVAVVAVVVLAVVVALA